MQWMLRVNEVACAHDIPFASNNILANAVILASLAFICNVLKPILTYEPVFYFIYYYHINYMLFNLSQQL